MTDLQLCNGNGNNRKDNTVIIHSYHINSLKSNLIKNGKIKKFFQGTKDLRLFCTCTRLYLYLTELCFSDIVKAKDTYLLFLPPNFVRSLSVVEMTVAIKTLKGQTLAYEGLDNMARQRKTELNLVLTLFRLVIVCTRGKKRSCYSNYLKHSLTNTVQRKKYCAFH